MEINRRKLKDIDIELALERGRLKYVEKLKGLYGVDTETLQDGRVFMLTDSDGKCITGFEFDDYFKFLVQKSHRGKIGYFYNTRFDVDGIFNLSPDKSIKEGIVGNNWFKYKNYEIRNTGYKGLRIRKLDEKGVEKKVWYFFDISNFFPVYGLNECAEIYLHQKKKDIDVTKFNSIDWVNKHLEEIRDYCIQDSKLTQELAEYWQVRSGEFGFIHYPEYSIASYSSKLFANNCNIPLLRYIPKEVINYSWGSYQGGRFELLQKGSFEHVYEYDLNGAYANIIKNLSSLNGDWKPFTTDKDLNSYEYAFIDSEIKQNNEFLNPLGYKFINYCYPCLETEHYFLTKTEYELMQKYGFGVKINKGWGFESASYFKPFKREVERLLKLRADYKNKRDNFMDKTIKTVINSFYGKQVETNLKKGKLTAGRFFNPVYGSVITSEIRCKLLDLIYSKNLVEDLISVNTDAIHLTKNLGELDGFKKVSDGERGRYLEVGVYSIENKKTKRRGFNKPIDFFNEDLFDKTKNNIYVGSTRPCHMKETLNQNKSIDKATQLKKEYLRRGLKIPESLKKSLKRKPMRVNEFIKFPKYKTLDNNFGRYWQGELKNWNAFFNTYINSQTVIF